LGVYLLETASAIARTTEGGVDRGILILGSVLHLGHRWRRILVLHTG